MVACETQTKTYLVGVGPDEQVNFGGSESRFAGRRVDDWDIVL